MLEIINALLSKVPIVPLIILITGIISIYSFYHYRFYYALVLQPYSIAKGRRLYTLFTAALVHTGWAHLLLNLVCIYFIGSALENELTLRGPFGHLKFLFLYSCSILAGNLGSARLHRKIISYRSAGASNGIYAILGAYGTLNALDSTFELPLIGEVFNVYLVLLIMAGLIYMLKFRKNEHVDHATHLFGFLSGIVIIMIYELFSHWNKNTLNLFI